MSTSESFQALRRANPRARAGFAESVAAVVDVVRPQVADVPPTRQRRLRVRVAAAGVSLAAAAAAAVLLAIGSTGGRPVVESAAAAVRNAATLTAASAERSGTAVVRITHDGELWAGVSVRWNGGDLALLRSVPRRLGRPGSEFRLVDGMMYGIDTEASGWVALGSPASIDPGSGTMPSEYLAAVREDVGGATLSKIARGVNGLTTTELADGSTVYSGTVAAGLIAPKTGFKEGRVLRVLPFGYVAHDEAADPSAPLDAAVTIGPDGLVRRITVAWGSWTYTVDYSALGSTPAPVAPENPRPLRERLGRTVDG
jgi:hypothetical protein